MGVTVLDGTLGTGLKPYESHKSYQFNSIHPEAPLRRADSVILVTANIRPTS